MSDFFKESDIDLNTVGLSKEFLESSIPTKYISLERANKLLKKNARLVHHDVDDDSFKVVNDAYEARKQQYLLVPLDVETPPPKPREIWLYSNSLGQTFWFEEKQTNPGLSGEFHVIDKSAYDEQKKEIEALMRNECGCLDDLAAAEAERDTLAKELASYQKQADINQKLVSELAAAKAELTGAEERLAEYMIDWQKANARIKELETDNLLALGIADKFANERDEMKEREQKLVAAMQLAIDWARGAHMLGGPLAGLEEALKAHKGGA